jgi:cytochrome P450
MARTPGKRPYAGFSIAAIDQPQIAEELCWQAQARKTIQEVFTPARVRQYVEARLDAAINGDRTASQQVDRMLGIGVPITVNVTGTTGQGKPETPLIDRMHDLLAQEERPLSVAQIAARCGSEQAEVLATVRKNLGRPFRLVSPNEVTLEQHL